MTDTEFLFQFESCQLPKDNFNHLGHLRITWLYLKNLPVEVAVEKVSNGIMRYATHLGVKQIYHETLTRAWIYLVKQSMSCSDQNFSQFIQRNHQLFNKKILTEYYSSSILNSDFAKEKWIEPDLRKFKI